ncbi:DEAD/DEAH box helicase [Gracilinema caldarium]|uniref:DEAD/DEAH box helicase n=1 Tax=Gracilinema caldarium TaxID=215591 RepID=UPI0026ECBB76|nr:DEAD/DEAH box helicase [Gracilinema caldarium]
MAHQYGTTPWGAWFVEVLGTYGIDARLQRGKTYANTGKVLSLIIQNRKVTAKVKGHSSPSYTVQIEFPVLEKQNRLFELIQDDPMLLSRIQVGELPMELVEVLRSEHIALIPERWGDMKRFCTCPDWGDPCKHMAAVYYVLARQIDADPHVLFKLRGIDLESHFGTSLSRDLESPFRIAYVPENSEALALPSEAPHPFPDGSYAHFIQALLPPKSSFTEKDFSLTLMDFYHRAIRKTIEGHDIDEDLDRAFSRARWSVTATAFEPSAMVHLHYTLPSGKEGTLSLLEAADLFLGCAQDEGTAEYRFFFYFFRLMRSLWDTAAFIPIPWVDAKMLHIYWKPMDSLPAVRSALEDLSRYEPGLLSTGGTKPKRLSPRSAVDFLACIFLTEQVHWVDYGSTTGSERFRAFVSLFFKGNPYAVNTPVDKSLPQAIDAWLAVLRTDFTAWQYRCTLSADPGAKKSLSYRFSFEVLLDGAVFPLAEALERTGNRDVLRAPAALSAYLPEIRALSREPSVLLSEERLATFLEEAGPLLSRLGVQVLLPKELHRELKPHLVLQDKGAAASLVSYLDLESLVSYEWKIAIGDQILTADEFEKLVSKKTALVRLKDGYVRLDPVEIAALLKRARAPATVSAMDVLKTHFANEVRFSPELDRSISKLLTERRFPAPQGLKAELRPYQMRGYNWACSLLMAGFGCILADDMGLGKTIQAIAVLLRLEEEGRLGEGGALIVAPSALLSNWERELERFAPSLSVARYHGTKRSLSIKSRVLLTTYQTAVRDSAKLASFHFSCLIADEAHLMKNATTALSKTIKSFQIPYRLALSGTPVENRLEDLRSLFDFILPGYLGSAETFKKEYRKPIEVDRQQPVADKLRSITAPFLLRRLKTDKTIISDLPDKITINEYASLEGEQAALYESIVRNALAASETLTEKSERAALILKLLTSLKQICDHPRCYDKESPALASLSGKSQLLLALLEEILLGNEKVLIFSQYVETLNILKEIIMKELEEDVLVYHGGLGQKKRDQAVQEFQTNPLAKIMLVSLKAGGLGLNLTAASRVIHYDLWFNPAIENQATDRAFRIGQRSNVFVHRFITRNTFEEKIDAMLRDKRELADMTVASGESWLTRMSHEELRSLFTL